MKNGLNNSKEIADSFGRHFESACTPDCTQNAFEKARFEEQFNSYPVYLHSSQRLNVELVDKVVFNMKKGKAAGADGLTIEHIQYAHPSVLLILSNLFHCMLCIGFVPDSFGVGVTFPLLKENVQKPS